MKTILCYDIYELALEGPGVGNPFLDVKLSARFQHGSRVVEAEGFYDGDGVYRLRCMPDRPGEWSCTTQSNIPALDGRKDSFTCTPARPGVHGPVRVGTRGHFIYDDGAPFFQVGTTCYAWNHQGDALEDQTLASLAAAPL